MSDTRKIPPLGLNIWPAFPRRMHHSHSHEDLEINLLRRGSITCLHGPRLHAVAPGGMAIFWAGVPHTILETSRNPAPEGIWMTIPLEWFLQWQLPGNFTGRLLAGDAAVFSAQVVAQNRWVDLARDWMGDLQKGPDHQRILRMELESRLLRLILADPDTGISLTAAQSPGEPGAALRTFLRVVAHLHQNFADPDLNAETTARAVGLHPKYLLRLFPNLAGVTFLEYLHRLRVARAKLQLVETRDTILSVAADVGFRSPSAFYEAFSRHTTENLSPAKWRRRIHPR